MELNADRLAKLAGLKVSARESLNEASNRSYHDGDSNDEVEHRFGKNQLAESEDEKDLDEESCGTHEGEEQEEAMVYESDDDADDERGEDAEASEGYDHMMDEKHDDDLMEIDEAMLAEEISRMRQERLQENELRSIIRNEVASIVSQMKKSTVEESNDGSKEITGITKGFVGPGF